MLTPTSIEKEVKVKLQAAMNGHDGGTYRMLVDVTRHNETITEQESAKSIHAL